MEVSKLAKHFGIFGLLLALQISGCGGSNGSGPTIVSTESSIKARTLAPAPEPATERAVVTAVNAFGADLLGRLDSNAVVAPFSAALPLARLRSGAGGTTLAAINEVMHLTGTGSGVDPAFNGLDLGISTRIGASSLGGELSLASVRGWAQARYGYLITYLDALAENYGLKPVRTDFALAHYVAKGTITDWAFQASGLTEDELVTSQDTRLVLGDAVRLNAEWADPFDRALTETGWFQSDSAEVQVPFLRKTTVVRQTAGDGYSAVELPLAGGGLRFLAVVPDAGRYTEIQGRLTAEWLGQVVAAMAPVTADLALPKFNIVSEVQMGLGFAAVRDVADFSAIDGTKDLFVSSTLHRSKFSVTEAGIQAGSITLVALDDSHPDTWTDPNSPGYYNSGFVFAQQSLPSEPASIILGRPFLFALRDSVSGTLLFLGRVMNPAP